MSSEQPIAKSLAKGFKFTHTQCLIGNLKKVFVELSKSEKEEHQMMMMQAMIFAPLSMLQVSANLNITFDDFEEIEEHPMAQPFMATFDQLFEGVAGQPWNEFMSLSLDTEGISTDPEDKDAAAAHKFSAMHSLLCALVSDMNSQGNI